MSVDVVAQLTASGVITGFFYSVMAIGFTLIIGTTGRFHFAFGIVYALAGYLVFTGTERLGLPFYVTVIVTAAIAAGLGMAIEAFLYKPLERRAGRGALLAIFITALGITLLGQNLIKLIWGPSDLVLQSLPIEPYSWGPVSFVGFDIGQVITGIVIIAATIIVLRTTNLGRQILAVKSNPNLAAAGGLAPERVFLIVFAIGSAMAVFAGMWQYAKFTISAQMGFAPTLTAFVIAFIAGLQLKPMLLVGWSFAIALAERYVTIWLDVAWSNLVVLVGLLAYLVLLSARTAGLSQKIRRRLQREQVVA